MSTDHTPSTDDVRHAYVSARSEDEFAASYLSQFEPEFDRWLKAHDAEVAAQAVADIQAVLDARDNAEVAECIERLCGPRKQPEWIRDRTNQITKEDR